MQDRFPRSGVLATLRLRRPAHTRRRSRPRSRANDVSFAPAAREKKAGCWERGKEREEAEHGSGGNARAAGGGGDRDV